MRLVFDYKIFDHVISRNKIEGRTTSKVIVILSKLMRLKFFTYVLSTFENILGFILTLPIPIYKSFIHLYISNIEGLPKYFGMYLRAIYYKKKLKFMGTNVFIDQGVIISNPSEFQIHEFSYIDKNVSFLSEKTRIGKRCHIAGNVFVGGGGDFVMHDYAGIAPRVNIITSSESFKNGVRASGPMVKPEQRKVVRGKVTLEKDAFLSTGVTVLPNVVIGEGSLIGAGVTVYKNTSSWTIHVNERSKQIGNREKVIFEED